jgi:hypothetical protein
MWRASMSNFIRGQGFLDIEKASTAGCYKALMFQPRLIGLLAAAGILLQSASLFLALAAILWWNALLPGLNLFDALYNALFAAPPGLPRLGPAPAPRRFAQALASTFMLLTGIALLQGWSTLASMTEALIAVVLLDLLFRRSCLGSALFNLLRRRNTPAAAGETRAR